MSDGREPFPWQGTPEDETTARLLRRALDREAMSVAPSEDGLDRITERTGRGRGRRWVPWLAAAAAAVVVGGVVGATALGGDDGGPGPASGGTSAPATAGASSGPTSTPGDGQGGEPGDGAGVLEGVPVYWVGETEVSYRLFREFRDVPDAGGRVASAVSAMTSLRPRDPDYSTPWAPASNVQASVDGEAITVDLSRDAFADGVGSELAELAVQQLVYTATAAAQQPGPVTVTVDGEPYDAWGTVALGEPMRRAPLVDVQNPVWLLSPAQDATVPEGTVEFTGYGTAFEGTFAWEVRELGGEVAAEGTATGGSMGEFGELGFTADLTPGEYVVEVWQPDVSDGESPEGPRMYPDSKQFTVR